MLEYERMKSDEKNFIYEKVFNKIRKIADVTSFFNGAEKIMFPCYAERYP